MNCSHRLRPVSWSVCVLLATMLVAASHRSTFAADRKATRQSQDVRVVDGAISGYIVTGSGHPVAAAELVGVCSDGRPLAIRSDAAGRFWLPVVDERTVTIFTGEKRLTLRLWRNAAPPAAIDSVAVVVPSDVLRGEDTLLGFPPRTTTTIAVLAGITTIVLLSADDDSPSSP